MRRNQSVNKQGRQCFFLSSGIVALWLIFGSGALAYGIEDIAHQTAAKPTNSISNESVRVLAQDQPVRSQQMFENVKVKPNFSPTPLELRGFSGGSLPASKVVEVTSTPTGPCRGFVDEQPDHTIVLTDFFDYLSLQVESPKDTTLIIKGPGGSWCNDDFQGKNPSIVGEWLAGTYQVWVGSYKINDYHPYVLKLSEIEP
ncbi:MAG: hypothetical protein WA919_20115 [Coleofasciculaceae cyanobacterium]